MLSAGLPAWKYVVLVLSCISAFGLGYFNVLDYTHPLTKKQRIWNSACLWSFLVFTAIVVSNPGFYSKVDPGEVEPMDF